MRRASRASTIAALLWRQGICTSTTPIVGTRQQGLSGTSWHLRREHTQLLDPIPAAAQDTGEQSWGDAAQYQQQSAWAGGLHALGQADQAQGYPQSESQGQAWQAPLEVQSSSSGYVDPPARCAWHHEHVNSVKLIGLVGAPPEVRHLSGGQVVARVSLGLLPRFNRSRAVQREWMSVDFWGHEALQVEQYVQKGMQLAVGGHLKRDKWKTDLGGERSVTKVVAEYFQVVEPSVGTLVSDGEDSSQSSASASAVSSTGGLPQTTKQPRSKQPSAKAKAAHQIWLEDPQMTWGSLPWPEGAAPERVIGHLVDCACHGIPTDIPRLAAQLQIGFPGSPWMTVAELNAAIDTAQQQAAALGDPSELDVLRLKPIRNVLVEQDSATGTKLLSQEQACGSKIGLALTYGQIRLALASRRMGLDLEKMATRTPLPVTQLLGDAQLGYQDTQVPTEPPF